MHKPDKHVDIKKSVMPAINHLRNYHAPRRLKLEASKIIMNHLTADKFDELRDVFQALDVEGTGFISAKNLKSALEAIGLDIAACEIQKVIVKAGYLRKGKLDYMEFLLATINLKSELSE
jgi:Ca2+-binding EF-hand superfamily protein